MTSLIVCIKRKPGMTVEEFSQYWRGHHGPLIRSVPDFTRHLVSYTQYHLADQDSPVAKMFGVSSDYDGVAVLTFKSAEALEQAFQEPAYLEHIRPDEFHFVDLENCIPFLTEAVPIKAADEA